MQPGEFNKTIRLKSYTEADPDGLGHAQRTFCEIGKCAARLWQLSTAERTNPPAEFDAADLRLLLYRPPANTAPQWRFTYAETEYEITSAEWRDEETTLLITAQKV